MLQREGQKGLPSVKKPKPQTRVLLEHHPPLNTPLSPGWRPQLPQHIPASRHAKGHMLPLPPQGNGQNGGKELSAIPTGIQKNEREHSG